MLCLLLCLATLPAAACIPTSPALPSAGHWPSDPRLPQLGQRAVLGAEDRPSFQGDEQQTEPVEYRRWRIEQGVAEGRDEIEGAQLWSAIAMPSDASQG